MHDNIFQKSKEDHWETSENLKLWAFDKRLKENLVKCAQYPHGK